MLEDWTTADIEPRLRAGLRLAEALTRHPEDIDAGFLAALDLDRAAIETAANVTFHYNFINRLADAFDFPLLDDDQRYRLAKLLDRATGRATGPGPDPSWVRGDDGLLRPVELDYGRRVALEGPGVTDATLRAAVEARAAHHHGAARGASEQLPEALLAYVDKLSRWAYKIIDEDVDALREAGFDDEAIFELTYAGAFGASIAPLEHLFGVLYGAETRERAA